MKSNVFCQIKAIIIAQKSDLNQDLETKILNIILQSFEII